MCTGGTTGAECIGSQVRGEGEKEEEIRRHRRVVRIHGGRGGGRGPPPPPPSCDTDFRFKRTHIYLARQYKS